MSLFHFPKVKHVRTATPRHQFVRYQTYKRYLQVEFSRLCVYCRQPDSSAPSLNFGVDHYRPSSKFALLKTTYTNLFYCCGSCNSRKNNFWPETKTAPVIVNPCDFEMASHLKFNGKSGIVETRSPDGAWTESLLQLNDDATVQYRRNTIMIVSLIALELDKLSAQLKNLDKLFLAKKLTQAAYDADRTAINADIKSAEEALQAQTGTTPLPRLRKP